jgi:hypothetical protein
MKKMMVSLIAIVAATTPVVAQVRGGQEPVFTTDKDRTDFADRLKNTCVPTQRAMPNNRNISDGELDAYCGCVAKAAASSITVDEYVYLVKNSGAFPDSFLQRTKPLQEKCSLETLGKSLAPFTTYKDKREFTLRLKNDCLSGQRKLNEKPENVDTSFTEEQTNTYCECTSTVAADVITADELRYMNETHGKVPESFRRKTNPLNNKCAEPMLAAQGYRVVDGKIVPLDRPPNVPEGSKLQHNKRTGAVRWLAPDGTTYFPGGKRMQ